MPGGARIAATSDRAPQAKATLRAALPPLLLGGIMTAEALAATPAPFAAIGNLLAALRFGVTLLPGREPLISRYSRFDAAGPPPAVGAAYTRRLTALWAALLGGFASLYALAALLAWPLLAVAAAQLLLCGGLFLGEHAVRNRRFPEQGRATPLRTLRAIRLSWRAAAARTQHVA